MATQIHIAILQANLLAHIRVFIQLKGWGLRCVEGDGGAAAGVLDAVREKVDKYLF